MAGPSEFPMNRDFVGRSSLVPIPAGRLWGTSWIAAGGIARFSLRHASGVKSHHQRFSRGIVSVALKSCQFKICSFGLSTSNTSCSPLIAPQGATWGFQSELAPRPLALCSLDFPQWREAPPRPPSPWALGILA